MFDEPFGGRNKIIEHVLLVELRSGLMPFFPVLSAASQVRHREDTPLLQPVDTSDRKAGWE